MVENEENIFHVPRQDVTRLFAKNPLFASIELNKHLEAMHENQPWPTNPKTNYPTHFLIGLDEIQYPDIGHFERKHDLYGPGAYCYAACFDRADTLGALLHGQNKKLQNNFNSCVLLLKLLNDEEVFAEKVSQLCSDWDENGRTKSRSVSTNGTIYVFHPRIDNVLKTATYAKILASKGESYPQLSTCVIALKNDLKRIEEHAKLMKTCKKELDEISKKIVERLEHFDYGLFWSKEQPQLLRNDFHVYKSFLKENDANFDENLVDNVGKKAERAVELREMIDDGEQNIIEVADRIEKIFNTLLRKCRKLHQYESIKELSYLRSKMSSLRLSARGIRNNIQAKQEAKFKIEQIFVIEPTPEARISRESVNHFKAVEKIGTEEEKYYDSFKYEKKNLQF